MAPRTRFETSTFQTQARRTTAKHVCIVHCCDAVTWSASNKLSDLLCDNSN